MQILRKGRGHVSDKDWKLIAESHISDFKSIHTAFDRH